jgi:hypothetical protein
MTPSECYTHLSSERAKHLEHIGSSSNARAARDLWLRWKRLLLHDITGFYAFRYGKWNVPQCTTMYHNVPRCTTMYHNVPQCTTMYHNVPRCTTMYHDVPRCTTMYHDVPQCTTMYHNVPRCTTMYHDVPQCTTFMCSAMVNDSI